MRNPWATAGKILFLWVAIPASLLALGYYVLGPRMAQAQEETGLVGKGTEPAETEPAATTAAPAPAATQTAIVANNVRSYPAATIDEPSVDITVEASSNRSARRVRSTRIANEDGSSEPTRRRRAPAVTPPNPDETTGNTPDPASGAPAETSRKPKPKQEKPKPTEPPATPPVDPASGGGSEPPPSTPTADPENN